MYRKSNSSLSTTISSTNYSISSNGEQEQNEISAIISSYTLKQDDNKFFNKNYAFLFQFFQEKTLAKKFI